MSTTTTTDALGTPVPAEPGRRAPTADPRWGLAALTAGAGVIHLTLVPAHLGESVALGVGFAVAGWAQLGLAVLLVARPARRWLVATALANLAFLAAWAVSRTVGLPFGLEAGPEAVGFIDGLCAAFEAAAVTGALVALRPSTRGEAAAGTAPSLPRFVGAALVPLSVVVLTTAALAAPSSHHDHGDGDAHGEEAAAHDHGTETAGHDHGETAAGTTTDEHADGHDHGEAAAGTTTDEHVDEHIDDHADGHDHTDELPTTADAGIGLAADGHSHTEGVSHFGSDGHHNAACSAPATPEEQADADALVAGTDAGVAKYADFDRAVADGYVPITPPGAPLVHYGNFSYMTDGDILDPDRVESLMYAFDKNRTPYFVGAMYLNDTPEIAPPTPGGCLTQWHDHTNLCIAPGQGMVGVVAADGSCPAGSSNEVTTQMIHVWTIPLPDGPLSHEAPADQVKAGILSQRLAQGSGT